MDGWIQIGTDLDTKTFDTQIEQLELKIKELENDAKAFSKLGDSENLRETNLELEKTKNKLISLIEKKERLEDVGNGRVTSSLNNINSSTGNIIKKVGQWALAVFSVRGAYSMIRNAMSTLTQYNKQLASDISYIQYALAKILEPIILGFVNIVYKLLAYVNYLAQAWFNVNLFAGASAKSFISASNGLSKASKNAKELKNATQGFDEMNILQDNSSDSSTTSGVATPSMDLSNLQDVEIPEWLVKFKEFCQPVIDFFKEIIDKYGPVAGGIIIVVGAIAGFLILKSIISLITGLGKTLGGVSVDFTGFFNALGRAVEAIAILGGLTLVIKAITELIDTFSQSGLTLGEVGGLLAISLGGVAVAFIAIAAAMKFLTPSWQSIAGAVVIFAGLAAVLLSVTALLDAFARSGMSLGEVIGLIATILISIVALMASVALLGPMMTAGLLPFIVVIAGISALLIVIAATLPVILDACAKFMNAIAPVIIAVITTINECINNTIKALGEVLPPIIKSVGQVFSDIFNRNSQCSDKCRKYYIKNCKFDRQCIYKNF